MTTQHIIPTTQASLEARVRSAAPKLALYNGNPGWYVAEYGGTPHYFPPDLGEGETVVHPRDGNVVPADGTLKVASIYGTLRDAKGKTTGVGIGPGLSAEEIVLFFENIHGEKGIVFLTGNPKEDEPRKALARKKARAARLIEARAQLDARDEFIANFRKNHPAQQTLPRMKPEWIRAQEFVDEAQDEAKTPRGEYVCKHDNYETSDRVKYERHMRLNHGEDVSEEPSPEPETPKRGPGRPKKVAED